jgi:broad specificity phosphatase PhoE
MTPAPTSAPTPPPLPRLYLVRHGETEWSRSGQHTSHTEVPLTEAGEAQARRLRPALRHLPVSQAFTSPRRRARDTAELARLALPLQLEPLLAEWNYGEYEGLRSADIVQLRPGWNLYEHGCPQGDSPAQVADRADSLLAKLARLEASALLFTHGHFGRVLAARWLGLPVTDASRLLLSPASLSILAHEHERRDLPVLALWNFTASLML